MKYVWPPLITTINARQEEIAKGLDDSKKAKVELETAIDKSNSIIKEANLKAQEILTLAEQNKKQIIMQAEVEATKKSEKMIAQSLANIKSEKDKVKQELNQKVSHIAIEIAQSIISEKVDLKSIDTKMFKKLVAEI